MLLFSPLEIIKTNIKTVIVTSRHLLHAVSKINKNETCSKTKESVINRKINVLMLNMDFISLVTQDF